MACALYRCVCDAGVSRDKLYELCSMDTAMSTTQARCLECLIQALYSRLAAVGNLQRVGHASWVVRDCTGSSGGGGG